MANLVINGQLNEQTDLNAQSDHYVAFPFRISYMGKGVKYEC
jgi:hypothetical protein